MPEDTNYMVNNKRLDKRVFYYRGNKMLAPKSMFY